MADNYTRHDLDSLKKISKYFRIIAVSLTAIVIVCLCIGKHDQRVADHQEQERIRLEYLRQHEEEMRQIAIREQKCQEQYRLDSIIMARISDSISQLPPPSPPAPPRYTYEDVNKMVQKVAHENYCASAWQIDEDNWIMHYSSGDDPHTKHYLRKFNVYKKTYGPAMRIRQTKTGEYRLMSNHNKVYRQEGPFLVYYNKGVEKGRWHHHGHLLIELDTPEEPYEGYESWEDYYYDNEEDLRFYYGR